MVITQPVKVIECIVYTDTCPYVFTIKREKSKFIILHSFSNKKPKEFEDIRSLRRHLNTLGAVRKRNFGGLNNYTLTNGDLLDMIEVTND